MRERALAVAVPHRPDAWNVGAELIVDLNKPAGVDRHSRFFEAKIVRIGAPSGRNQHMRAADFRARARRLHADDNLVALSRKTLALGPQEKLNSFALENVENRGGDVLIFARDQPGSGLNDGYLAAKAPEHLP